MLQRMSGSDKTRGKPTKGRTGGLRGGGHARAEALQAAVCPGPQAERVGPGTIFMRDEPNRTDEFKFRKPGIETNRTEPVPSWHLLMLIGMGFQTPLGFRKLFAAAQLQKI